MSFVLTLSKELSMMKHVILGFALAACSAPAETATAPQREPLTAREPAAPAHVTAMLNGAGSCVAHTCTMHFAVHARGNTSTFTAKRCHDATCPTRSGQLTTAAQSEASKLASQLAELKLEPVYGSPGSADGPIYVVLVHRADGTE
jgi:hypothetical protein